jgi:cardiolipin synthase
MRRGIAYFLIGIITGLAIYHASTLLLFPAVISPVFSPENGAEIISLIDSAETSIDIEMYVFTSRDVIEALERARNRGVKIRIIIERNTIGGGNEQTYQELASKGFNTRYASSSYKLTHSKFMIVDGQAVLVGSHNFSNSAIYENREASVILREPAAVDEFSRAFEKDWAMAV